MIGQAARRSIGPWSPRCRPSWRCSTCRWTTRVAGARPAAASPAHPRRRQAAPASREPGAAAPAGLRGPPLDRRRDPGPPRQPGREPADRPPPAARQLPARVRARAGAARPTTPSSGSIRCRPRAPRSSSRRCSARRQPPAAQAPADRAHRGQPVLPRGERPDAGRDRASWSASGARYRLAKPLPGDPGARHGAGGPGRPHRPAAARGQAAAPDRRRHRQGRAVRPAPGHRRAARRRRSARASPTSRRPSSSTRRSLFPDLEYTFKHALTHEVAYGSLLQERRRALHARIVEAIERLYPDRLAEQVERLAHHALRGEVWEQGGAATSGRPGPRRSRARPTERRSRYFEQALDGSGAPAREPRDTPSRPSISASICATRSIRSENRERILEYLRRSRRVSPTALDDRRRLGGSPRISVHHFWRHGDHDRGCRVRSSVPWPLRATLGDVALTGRGEFSSGADLPRSRRPSARERPPDRRPRLPRRRTSAQRLGLSTLPPRDVADVPGAGRWPSWAGSRRPLVRARRPFGSPRTSGEPVQPS